MNFWSINIGQVVTLAVMAVGFIFGLGKLFQKIDNQGKELAQLRVDFHEHVRDDRSAFDKLNETLLKWAMGGKV